MPDMLVKLYTLPDLAPHLESQKAAGIDIRRALAFEMRLVADWVRREFDNDFYANECQVAFSRQPISCFVAVKDGKLIGFACYESTAKDFFGPTAVTKAARGQGTGAALLLVCLHAMYAEGYGYAIIGSVGPAEFYSKVVGATIIPDSTPGIYRGMLSE